MLFVYVAAARLSVTSGASPPFYRNWDDSETTQQKHYSCHAISVHVINLPTHLYCITYWLADNLRTLFLRSDSASSSTATPSTSASTTPALKRCFCQRNCRSLGLQMTGVRAAAPALVPWCMPKSTNTFMNFGHLCQRKMPSPSGGDCRQPIHSLPHLHKT